MRTVTVEVPEGHMVKIVKEESMQPTQKVTGGGKFEFEGETFKLRKRKRQRCLPP